MARVPYLDKSDVAAEYQELLSRPINLFRALVHSPEALKSFSRLGGFIRNKSRLDPRLREMAILQVGYLAKSVYEYTHHIEIGRTFGVTDDDIRAVADETAGKPTKLDALSKAVLKAAREMTLDINLSDATFAELKKSLDHERIIDLFVTIGFYNCVVRVLAAVQIDNEEKYRHYLDEFPFAKS